jgi:hypothetical protein
LRNGVLASSRIIGIAADQFHIFVGGAAQLDFSRTNRAVKVIRPQFIKVLWLAQQTSPSSFMSKISLQPGSNLRESRMCFGIVTWPLLVSVVSMDAAPGITSFSIVIPDAKMSPFSQS